MACEGSCLEPGRVHPLLKKGQLEGRGELGGRGQRRYQRQRLKERGERPLKGFFGSFRIGSRQCLSGRRRRGRVGELTESIDHT